MKLAINYSTPAAELVKSGLIHVDRFKTPNWNWMVDEAKALLPVAIHFDLEAGNGHLDEVNWDEVESLVQNTGTPFINLHLDPKQKHHRQFSVETQRKSEVKTLSESILSDISIVVGRFGPERVILENSPYRGNPGNTMRMSVEPDFINQIVKETGCGFLLDISHAIITAQSLDMDTDEYFERLPTDRIKELHFAGVHKLKGQLIDHLSIRKKDWRWLDWVLEHVLKGNWSTPWLMAFEYGGVGDVFEWRTDPQVMQEQVPILYERVEQLKQSMTLVAD
jgi:uncharacterized protein (UPF0276 family)